KRISMDGGSWTNNISWVHGYGDLLGPMERLSSLFYEKVLRPGIPASDPRYRQALFFLLVSETSCFRYWGEGLWTDYGKELCRRGTEFLEKAF
ncbi:MAG: glycosyl hydrolase family 57, partial [Gammaproteobacteria bacterium]|nr:glycosyl hydrolase family 57 [Gammaproteobacteria bacterium]